MQTGDLIGPVRVGPVAHGGHCVARVEGRVVFVRHVLPDELVTAQVTEVAKRFARADAVEVLEASSERVSPPCPNAGRCGGCDFQHVTAQFQAELKRRVMAEQLQRLAGIDWRGRVEQVPPVLDSRVRMRFVQTPDGRLGLRAHRSHTVVPLPDDGCRIAHPAIPLRLPREMTTDSAATEPAERSEAPHRSSFHDAELIGMVSAEGGALVTPGAGANLTQRVGGRVFEVDADGFWQPHVAAPDVLTAAVLDGLRPDPGETAFDLYCGVGLFAAALVDAGCRVWGIEASRAAVAHAVRNVPQARFLAGDVQRTLRRLPSRADLVVLDPPRTGAGPAVVTAITALRPRAIGYVACDPAALARDLGAARELGYEPASIRGFDLFGMTHHLEAVAILRQRP